MIQTVGRVSNPVFIIIVPNIIPYTAHTCVDAKICKSGLRSSFVYPAIRDFSNTPDTMFGQLFLVEGSALSRVRFRHFPRSISKREWVTPSFMHPHHCARLLPAKQSRGPNVMTRRILNEMRYRVLVEEQKFLISWVAFSCNRSLTDMQHACNKALHAIGSDVSTFRDER